ncbi:hypothetical protein [Bradyrhizobium sp. CB2312]|uniref:cache domain-containing protein n=1 Tax=Bradyrhizobium sp. CB2312 TaxID=3039155 RepID=UPI0024B0F583|nr:hypothetical protein [Bradyrhizobium sp. CB2312]WFU74946.1 hypothetical protein QA642_13360 [Bradyrhizobium sp. CB2312]
MLDKAIAAVKADQVVALIKFTKGEDGFLYRDLYPFCFRISDAKTLATLKAVKAGIDVRSLKDNKGEAYGEALYAVAQKPEGQVTEIRPYMFPKPGTTEPLFPKHSFVTKVGELDAVSVTTSKISDDDHTQHEALVRNASKATGLSLDRGRDLGCQLSIPPIRLSPRAHCESLKEKRDISRRGPTAPQRHYDHTERKAREIRIDGV